MKQNLKQMAGYYRPYKKVFFSDMFFAVCGASVSLAIPLIARYIMYTVLGLSEAVARRQLMVLGGVMVLLVLIEFASNYYIGYFGHVMGAQMEHDMRSEIFGHYQKLSFAFYDNQKVGQLLSRVTSDLFDICELLHHGPEDLVISLIKLVGSCIILLAINPRLGLITLIFIPLMCAFAIYYNRKMKRAFKRNREKIARINETIEDSLSGIRIVQSFANEEVEKEKFESKNKGYVEAKKSSYRYFAGYNSGLSAGVTLITVVVIFVGSMLIFNGEMNAADLIAFSLYLGNVTDPIKKLIAFTEQFQNGYAGFERFREIMEIQPDITDAPDAISVGRLRGHVTYDDVSFSYGDDETRVLCDVSLDVPAGDYVALVGSSGVGKTTMLSLLPRFYDVSGGSITIDGMDIRKMKLHDLRNQIGIVQQDVYLFAGTVMDNIRYGNPHASDEDVVRAARLANAHDFIKQLPDGYATDIGQRGVKLSGGQKQRLSIARVFLKNPPILIFDEATSALDNESEHIVQESLEKLAKDRTTFVIAHRLSTIQNAKRIIVLTDKGIAESGTHRELIERDGEYAKFYRMSYA